MENNYYTVKEFAAKNRENGRWPTSEASIRFIKSKSHEKGFEKAFIKVGGRVLIDEEIFYNCVKGIKD